jgi:DNA-binding transcriptional MerR regulator
VPADARIRDVLAGLFGGEGEPALSASDVASHARDLLEAAGAVPEILERSLTERTVRYYQSQGIVTPPSGNTTNARYGTRQVLEAAAARLAGSVRHLSLAEAADEVAARDEEGLVAMISDLLAKQPRPMQRARPLFAPDSHDAAAFVAEGRPSYGAARETPTPYSSTPTAFPNSPTPHSTAPDSRTPRSPAPHSPVSHSPPLHAPAAAAWVVDLGDGAFLTIPADHPLLRAGLDPTAVRRRLLDALAD